MRMDSNYARPLQPFTNLSLRVKWSSFRNSSSRGGERVIYGWGRDYLQKGFMAPVQVGLMGNLCPVSAKLSFSPEDRGSLSLAPLASV